MSYLLDGVDDHLTVASTPVSDVPLTIGLWFKKVGTGAEVIAAIGDDGVLNNSFYVQAGSGIGPVQAVTRGDTTANADSTTGYTVNTWHHACAVYAQDDARYAFIDGGSKGTNLTARTVDELLVDSVILGRRPNNTASTFFEGRLAEVAIWNVALSDAQVALLAAGDNPQTVQAANLVGYWRLKDDANDRTAGARHLTVSGAVLDADHPLVDEPPAPSPQGQASISGGGTIAVSGQQLGLGPQGQASVSGGGAIATEGHKHALGGSISLVTGNVSTAGLKLATNIAAISGGGATNSTGLKAAIATVIVSGGGSITAIGALAAFGVASITGGGAVLSIGTKGAVSSVAISGGGAIAVMGSRQLALGCLHITGRQVATLTITGRRC